MELNRKTLSIGAVLLLTAYAFGRYSAPERVKIEKEIVTVEVEKKETSKQRITDEDKKTTILEVVRPDGTKVTKKVIESDKKTDTKVAQTVDSKSEMESKETKIIENSRRVSVSVIAGPNFFDLKQPIVFGGHVSRPFLGPITLGIWGLSSGTGGASVGLQF